MKRLIMLLGTLLVAAPATAGQAEVGWNKAMCPNGVEENLGKLPLVNPYDSKGRCFRFLGRSLQLLDQTHGLYGIMSSETPFALVDLGKKSAPVTFYSGVVVSKGAYAYETVLGARKVIFSFADVVRSKEREEWDTRQATAKKDLEAKEAAARLAFEEARRELDSRQATARAELEAKQATERLALEKAWADLDIKQAAEWEQLRTRQSTVRKEFWEGLSVWRVVWVGERELRAEVDKRESVEDAELKSRQSAARQALAQSGAVPWQDEKGYDELSSPNASERYAALAKRHTDAKSELWARQEAERLALKSAQAPAPNQ